MIYIKVCRSDGNLQCSYTPFSTVEKAQADINERQVSEEKRDIVIRVIPVGNEPLNPANALITAVLLNDNGPAEALEALLTAIAQAVEEATKEED